MTREIADRALTRLGVDDLGLDGADRRYLTLLAENYGGGPVGVETIAAALSEARDAIEEVIEPFLLQQGLIQRTPRGRMLAARAWSHLGLRAAAAGGPMRRPVRATTEAEARLRTRNPATALILRIVVMLRCSVPWRAAGAGGVRRPAGRLRDGGRP